jgi:tetratricopeptide (TPR) repeat protein
MFVRPLLSRSQPIHASPTLPVLILLCCVFLAVPLASAAQSSKPAENFDSLAKRAAEARDSDQLDRATSLYKQALALRPQWAEGWWSLGTLEYDRNHYASAARALQRLLVLAPKNGTAHAMLGLCEFELGQDDNALKHIREAQTLGVTNDTQLRRVVVYHEGVLLLRKGKFEAARDALGQLCMQGLQDSPIIQAEGMVALRVRGKLPPPQGSRGSEVVQRVGQAACLAAAKKYDEARQQFVALVSEYPNYPNIHYAYGRLLVEVNDVPAAVDQFKLEIENNPADITSRLEIAAALYKVDSAAALPYAEEAVKLDPHSAFAHYLFGLLLLDTDNYLKSIHELEIAAKAFPNEAKVFFALGSAYSRAGRTEEAARARSTFQKLSQQPTGDSKPAY